MNSAALHHGRRKCALAVVLCALAVCACAAGSDQPPGEVRTAVASGSVALRREFPEMPPAPPSADFVMMAAFGRFPELNAGQMAEFLNAHFAPEMYSIRQIAERNPNKAIDLLTDLILEAQELQNLQKQDSRQFERLIKLRSLEHAAARLAQTLKSGTGHGQAACREQLARTLQEIFEVKQEALRRDIEKLDEELSRLKALVQRRGQNRQAIISRRLADIVGGDIDTRW